MELNELKKKIPDMFEKVKRDVKKVLGRRRAGLNLGFVDMGMSNRGFIGGMFFSGGTMILMNVRALKVLIDHVETDPDKDDEIILSYVYHVMQHEYIHALGFLNERTCRNITYGISKEIFPEDHPVTMMARKGIGVYFPDFRYAPRNFDFKPKNHHIELIKDFDRSSTIYYV